MLQLARAIVGIVSDVLRLCVLFMRVSGAVRAENLVLRRQLARYIERGIKPKRVDHVTRVSLAPAIDPQAVGGPLPSRASAYVARSWGSRSPGTLDGGPQSRRPTSHRRTPCGARTDRCWADCTTNTRLLPHRADRVFAEHSHFLWAASDRVERLATTAVPRLDAAHDGSAQARY